MAVVFKAENQEYALSVLLDEHPENPRNWDNIGIMTCWHRKYQLGDKHDYRTSQDFLASLAEEICGDTDEVAALSPDEIRGVVFNSDELMILPLYLFDHSGLTMSTSPDKFRAMDSAGWDWAQVGWIHCTKEQLRKAGYSETGDELFNQAEKLLINELRTYNDYLTGNVYRFILEKLVRCAHCGHAVRKQVDSCWGFYGEGAKDGIMEQLGEEHHDLLEGFNPYRRL